VQQPFLSAWLILTKVITTTFYHKGIVVAMIMEFYKCLKKRKASC